MKVGGYGIITDPSGGVREFDTYTCSHCNHVHAIKKDDLGGFCRTCMHQICGPCADLGSCTPFLKKVELAERKQKMLLAITGG